MKFLMLEKFRAAVSEKTFNCGYALGQLRKYKNAGGHTHCNLEIVAYAACSDFIVTRKTEFFWCGDIRGATEALNFAPWAVTREIVDARGTGEILTPARHQNELAAQFGIGTKNSIVIAPDMLGAVLRDARRENIYI